MTAERKAELRQKGYKIIDAQFAPDDYEHPEPIKNGSGNRGDRPSKGLNVDQIKAALTEKGIEFDTSANKPVLAELLDKADQE
ncbi:HeH/LEM domain protein [compost metagenome]